MAYGTYSKATRHLYMRDYMRDYMRERRERLRQNLPLGRRRTAQNDTPPPAPPAPETEKTTVSSPPPWPNRSPLAPGPLGPCFTRRSPDLDDRYMGTIYYDVQKRGNRRYLSQHTPIIAEQCIRALEREGLRTNDVFNLGVLRANAKAAAWHIGGRMTSAQVAEVVVEVRQRAKVRPISHLAEAVRIARHFAQTRWPRARPNTG